MRTKEHVRSISRVASIYHQPHGTSIFVISLRSSNRGNRNVNDVPGTTHIVVGTAGMRDLARLYYAKLISLSS